MNVIYLVMGTAGCYSSTEVWTVRAYAVEKDAEVERDRLIAWIADHGGPTQRLNTSHCWDENGRNYDITKEPKPPGDPDFRNWGDVVYWVETVPFGAPK